MLTRTIRRSAHSLQATTAFEVEVLLGGTYQPGYPARGPSYSSGGEPGEPDSVEDIEIAGLGGIKYVRDPLRPLNDGRWVTTSLLDGVNVNSPDIQKLFANIIEYLGHEAENALLAEVDEDAA